MVDENNYIKTDENRIIDEKFKLNCKSRGEYFAQCSKCNEIYVGQINCFNVRWNAHRHNSKKIRIFSSTYKGEEAALFKPYFEKHHTDIANIRLVRDFKIMFLE